MRPARKEQCEYGPGKSECHWQPGIAARSRGANGPHPAQLVSNKAGKAIRGKVRFNRRARYFKSEITFCNAPAELIVVG